MYRGLENKRIANSRIWVMLFVIFPAMIILPIMVVVLVRGIIKRGLKGIQNDTTNVD